MQWKGVEKTYLVRAMHECKLAGMQSIREQFGFQAANGVHMYFGDRGPFEARPLIAVAYSKQHGMRLSPKDFTSTEAQRFLEKFGFRQVQIER